MKTSADTDNPNEDTEPSRSSDWRGRRLIEEAHALDQAVYNAVANTPTPRLDVPITWISNAANYGRLWIVIGAGIAVAGGPRGRRGAIRALSVLSVSSLTANLVVKQMIPRRRPRRSIATPTREARMPTSSSFPSGHTASAFGFATTLAAECSMLAAPLFGLATLVGYSRVHTGVHYPSDVIAGGILGCAMGTVARGVILQGGYRSLRRIV